jgi:hypothetical protein
VSPAEEGSVQRVRKLYCTAKAKPAFRLYTLYDKICRAAVERARLIAERYSGGDVLAVLKRCRAVLNFDVV